MPKKIIAALLLAALLLSLAGCSTIFKKQYVSVTDYTEDQGDDDASEPRLISDYDELKNALVSALGRHLSRDRYKFVGYEGSLNADLQRACKYAGEETAIGSYAVEDISYELNKIITYYEASVYITYKKSEESIKAISYISGKSALPESIVKSLEALETETVFSMNSSTITADDVVWAVFLALCEEPLSGVVLPAADVSIYPETGTTRIVELLLNYGRTNAEIEEMRGELTEKTRSLINIYGKAPATLFRALTELCEPYDAETQDGENFGNAYGALIEGAADSAGFALGFKALCDAAALDCGVVTGTLNGEYHCWNAIRTEGKYLYADASNQSAFGLTAEQLRSAGYHWDEGAYAAEAP